MPKYSLRISGSYEKVRAIGPLHTGGPVSVSEDGSHILTCVGEQVVLTRVADGHELRKFNAVST